jgi:hypothetical protein
VSPEAFVLALTAIVRPTSTVAVVAMLSTRRPQQLLAAYVLAGLVFSIGIGTLVVVVQQGFGTPSSLSAGRPLINTVLGAVALCYAVAVWIGWLPRPREANPAPSSPTWMQRHLQDLSPSRAAVAGVITHLPGLVYLAALNAIVGDARSPLNGIVQVLVYNAIWFSMPIVALVLSMHHPTVARECLATVASWTRRHQQVIMVVFLGGLGTYLLVVGVQAWPPRPV